MKYFANNSVNFAELNLQIIKNEKAEVIAELKKIKEQVAKNPRYINLCKTRMEAYQDQLNLLNKEAKDTRRNLRKCKKALEAME